MKNRKKLWTSSLLIFSLLLTITIGCKKDDSNGTDPDPNTVNDIDGNVYPTIVIGDQEWMAKNLKTTKYNDGAPIELVTDPGNEVDSTGWSYLTTGAYTWYNNNEASFGNNYGALYNWYAVGTGNLCPTGWRVPTDQEWRTLEGTLDTEFGVAAGIWNQSGYRGSDAGTKMKATSGWNMDGNGNNESGFTGLPGGYRYNTGAFNDAGFHGTWWSSTEYEGERAWRRTIFYDRPDVYRGHYSKLYGYSVRCIKE
jgi:uncharacterized protein (TIGR02145 family)